LSKCLTKYFSVTKPLLKSASILEQVILPQNVFHSYNYFSYQIVKTILLIESLYWWSQNDWRKCKYQPSAHACYGKNILLISKKSQFASKFVTVLRFWSKYSRIKVDEHLQKVTTFLQQPLLGSYFQYL